MSTVAATEPHVGLPPKQARRYRAPTIKEPHRFLGWKIQLLPYQLFFAHLGKLTVVALYFVFTQTLTGQHVAVGDFHFVAPDIKGTWDNLLTANPAHGGLIPLMSRGAWDPIRHLIRAVYEGLFGALLFGQIGFNALRYMQAKVKIGENGAAEAGRYDRFVLKYLNRFVASKYQTHPVTASQLIAWPVVITLASIPFVALGFGILFGVHAITHTAVAADHLSHHPSIASKIYSDSFQAVLVGLFAGFSPLVKAVTYPVFYTNSMYFGRRRLARKKHAHVWHPVTYRRLVQYLDLRDDSKERAEEALAERGGHVKALIALSAPVLVGLSTAGFFVLKTNGSGTISTVLLVVMLIFLALLALLALGGLVRLALWFVRFLARG